MVVGSAKTCAVHQTTNEKSFRQKISVLQHDLLLICQCGMGTRHLERTRALNAAKMDRMFAKPFVAALEGHIDAVEVLCRQPGSLTSLASGSWDGGIILHNLSTRKQITSIPQAHKGKVSGLCFSPDEGKRLLSCGVDRNIKLWAPLSVFPGKAAFNSIDHHRTESLFATASNTVQIWDETKSASISNLTFPTSTETITSVRFNMSESSVLASIGTDRTRRIHPQMRSNALSWSPTFPTTVLLASEDHNLYTFDIRHLDSPTQVYKAHVAAVMSCDWSPTGLEFVSGGWDRTVRIWQEGKGRQPEVYHTKRMQSSDDGNVRIWKAKASDKLGVVTARERAAMEYREKLKDRWRVDSEIDRVARTRHLPKSVHHTSKLKTAMLEARRVKEERRRKHTRVGESKPKPEKKKLVIAEQS
ncbi:WD40-repeat-containing domain protein [Gymnopilus junonius]|uniref:WD40-repeat-containing domain protein n=1 Tax=Gymnopilus junonius TaxID=109634 RepID=A0A9P5NWW2_GYMJU|nr:WD40-repeat-containing domain protein [Gymnopilus junonius]